MSNLKDNNFVSDQFQFYPHLHCQKVPLGGDRRRIHSEQRDLLRSASVAESIPQQPSPCAHHQRGGPTRFGACNLYTESWPPHHRRVRRRMMALASPWRAGVVRRIAFQPLCVTVTPRAPPVCLEQHLDFGVLARREVARAATRSAARRRCQLRTRPISGGAATLLQSRSLIAGTHRSMRVIARAPSGGMADQRRQKKTVVSTGNRDRSPMCKGRNAASSTMPALGRRTASASSNPSDDPLAIAATAQPQGARPYIER